MKLQIDKMFWWDFFLLLWGFFLYKNSPLLSYGELSLIQFGPGNNYL